ncbi:MAG: ABC transporter substrate-binding protein [Candidatus Heimdallarchaeota archaeon]|nr:ABC transporter substrate-binding protein [Candidatus Heimdallarchaeota archaeon]
MKGKKFSSSIVLVLLIFSIVGLDVSRRYLSGDFEGDKFELEILYSSEKAGWLESIVDDFEEYWSNNNQGKNIRVIMTPIGTGKGTIQVANGASKPAVWSPASRFWIPILNSLWATNNNNQIADVDSPSLVVSPSIIATWESYLKEYNITGFNDLRDLAINDPDFTFAHTDPFESNSGFGAVIMETAVAANKNPEDLTLDDLADDDVQSWMRQLESSAIQYGSSTGFLGKLMASEGPSKLKAAIIYENLVIEKNKDITEDKLVAIYPSEGTLLNDHPYLILDAPWVSDQDKLLANDFLDFLLLEETQIKAIKEGFRPAINIDTSIPEFQEAFTEENGVRESLEGIEIYSIGNIDSKILDRIPDLWSATRSRSLDDDSSEQTGLEPSDFIIPSIIVIIILLMALEPVIKKIRRYLK